MQLLLESLFNGVAIGSVLMMAALGLAIVFGLMGVINLAHGELIMLGAYTTYVVQMVFKLPAFQPIYSLYVLVAIPLAFVVSGVVGILLRTHSDSTSLWESVGDVVSHLGCEFDIAAICAQCSTGARSRADFGVGARFWFAIGFAAVAFSKGPRARMNRAIDLGGVGPRRCPSGRVGLHRRSVALPEPHLATST